MILRFIVTCLFCALFTTCSEKANSTSVVLNRPHSVLSKTTPNVLVSEGGSLVADKFSISDLNHETDHHSHVQPRKEAPKTDPLEESIIKNNNIVGDPFSKKPDPTKKSTVNVNMTPKTTNALLSNTSTSIKNNSVEQKLSEPVKKKPLVLSDIAVINANNTTGGKIPNVKSSSNPLDSNQIPSPNQNEPNYNFYSSIANRSPSIVIPVVITLLVVPVLAVLGYLGLKKGKEAWNNRHYKRMDFLLDGMYND